MYSFHQGLHAKMAEKLRQEHCTLLVESLRSGCQPAKQRAAKADCHSAFLPATYEQRKLKLSTGGQY